MQGNAYQPVQFEVLPAFNVFYDPVWQCFDTKQRQRSMTRQTFLF